MEIALVAACTVASVVLVKRGVALADTRRVGSGLGGTALVLMGMLYAIFLVTSYLPG